MFLSLFPIGDFASCFILNGNCHELRFFLMPNVALWLYQNLLSWCGGGHSGFAICILLQTVFSLGVHEFVHKSSG